MDVNRKIAGVTLETILVNMRRNRDVSLDEGKMNKAQGLSKIIDILEKDSSRMYEYLRLAAMRFCKGAKGDLIDKVKESWSSEDTTYLGKIIDGGFFQHSKDRFANGSLSLENSIRLIDGYHRRAVSSGNEARYALFINAKKYLINNPEEKELVLDFLHYVLGRVTGSRVPYTYRAKSWNNDYFKKLVDLRKSGEIFNGDRI